MTTEDLEREQASQAADSGISAEKAKDAKGTAKRLFKHLAKQRSKLLFVIVATLISCVLTMAAPLVIGKAIDIIFNGITAAVKAGTVFTVNFNTLGTVVIVLLGIYAANALCNYTQQYLMSDVAQNLAMRLRSKLNSKLSKLPLSYYDSHSRGDIMSRVTNDIERVADTLQQGLMQFITSVINIVGAVILMLIISPILTVVTLATIFIGMTITFVVAKKSHALFAENQSALGAVNSLVEESFSGRAVIKAFNKEPETLIAMQKTSERLCVAGRKAQFVSYVVMPAIRLFNQLGYMLIAVIGAVMIIGGKLSLGVVQAFFQYVNQVSEPITETSYIINTMQAATAAAERVFEILDAQEEPADKQGFSIPQKPHGNVNFEHVRFGYSANKILMENVNININAGQKIAIVGPTGAGKTTLVNLLMRFYDLQGGKISIDGIDIKEMARGDLRAMIGMVLQDAWIFGGTMKENIAYSRPEASFEEIRAAAKSARIDHYIRTLAQGYDTMLDDEGSDISQGQRQLITIARAILADPLILILDEATSSVDTRTELEIQKAMDVLMKGRTSFVIAHRLSTILDADCILVMNNGTIIEQGSHKELMRKSGFYAQLYNSQFAS